MVSMLLEEEKAIVDALRKYDCLETEQIIRLLHNKDREVAKKIILGLKKRQIIIEEEGYVKLDMRCKSDPKKIRAFWILLLNIKELKPTDYYVANFPSEIYFLKKPYQYEIYVLQPGDENTINILFLEDRNCSSDPENAIHYIFVVPSKDYIPVCVEKIPAETLQNNLIEFYTVDYVPNKDVPEINSYKIGPTE